MKSWFPRACLFASIALLSVAGLSYVVLPRTTWSALFFPVHAALHEGWVHVAAWLLAGALVASCKGWLRPAWYGVVAVYWLLGAVNLAMRLVLSRSLRGLSLFWIVVCLVLAAGLIAAWRSAKTPQPSRKGRAVALLGLLYVTLATGLYPLSYLVALGMRPAVYLEQFEKAETSARVERTIDGVVHKVYYGELHGHSWFSMDARVFGATPPDEYYRYARDVGGLDFAALTDHDSPDGISVRPELWDYVMRLADEYNQPGHFVTFKAFEWTSGEGHHELLRHWSGGDAQAFLDDHTVWGHRNVFFPGSEVPAVLFSHADADAQRPEDLWRKLREHGALAIPHHPLGGPVPAMKWQHFEPDLERLVELYSIHGNSEAMGAPLQIYNPYHFEGPSSPHSVQQALESGLRFGLIGATDTHSGWGGNGTTRPDASLPETMTEWLRSDVYGGVPVKGGGLAGVYAQELTRAAIWEALLARRTFATTGPRMVAALEADGVFMGGVVHVAPGRRVELGIEARGSTSLTKLELIQSGPKIREFPVQAGMLTYSLTWTAQEPAVAGSSYYYLRVTQADGEMAWSSPVFVICP